MGPTQPPLYVYMKIFEDAKSYRSLVALFPCMTRVNRDAYTKATLAVPMETTRFERTNLIQRTGRLVHGRRTLIVTLFVPGSLCGFASKDIE